jgi:hypothetical protein
MAIASAGTATSTEKSPRSIGAGWRHSRPSSPGATPSPMPNMAVKTVTAMTAVSSHSGTVAPMSAS